MGNVCECLSELPLLQSMPLMQTVKEDRLRNERLDYLRQGLEFERKKFTFGFGTGSETIRIFLNATEEGLTWRPKGSTKDGNISFVDIKELKLSTDRGVQIISNKGDVLLEIEAQTKEDRDRWREVVLAERDYLESGKASRGSEGGQDGEGQGGHSLRKMMEESAAKQKYWIQRQADIKMRQLEAADRKKKLGSSGMKYTALAMANRGSDNSKDPTD